MAGCSSSSTLQSTDSGGADRGPDRVVVIDAPQEIASDGGADAPQETAPERGADTPFDVRADGADAAPDMSTDRTDGADAGIDRASDAGMDGNDAGADGGGGACAGGALTACTCGATCTGQCAPLCTAMPAAGICRDPANGTCECGGVMVDNCVKPGTRCLCPSCGDAPGALCVTDVQRAALCAGPNAGAFRCN